MTQTCSAIKKVTGRALPLGGDDIDTDRIIPARFLLCTTFAGLGAHAFADDRAAPGHPFSDPRHAGASVLLALRNFGCGSSREHAPQALRRWGIRAVIAESLAEIFLDNATAGGVACVCLPRGAIEALMARVQDDPHLAVTVDLEAQVVRAGDTVYRATMDASVRRRLLEGSWDILAVLMEAADRADEVAGRLPPIVRAGA